MIRKYLKHVSTCFNGDQEVSWKKRLAAASVVFPSASGIAEDLLAALTQRIVGMICY